MRKPLAFVAPLPPPVHGFSNICGAMLGFLRSRANVSVFNRAPSAGGGVVKRLRSLADIAAYCVWCIRTTNAALYLGLSGGLGQIVDWPYIIIGKTFRRRVFIHHHSFAYINAPSLLNRCLFSSLREDTHIVLSQRMRSELVRIYRLNASKVKIVSNAAFYDVGMKHGEADSEHRGSPGADTPIRVGYLSAVSLEKGIAEFFAVLAELKRVGIPYQGYIAGPLAAGTKSQFDKWLAESSDVSYLGAVYGGEKDRFYRNLDVLLFPSDYANEAEPLVIHEALGSAVHVIACERGAIAEMLANGAGVVCPKPSFVASAVSRIRSFRHDTAGLQSAQRASFEQARRMHDTASAELEALLEEMAGPAVSRKGSAQGSARKVAAAAFLAAVALGVCNKVFGDVANNDTLEKALQAPILPVNPDAHSFDLFVQGQTAYDNNIFRLPSGADIAALIGPQASREDHINTASVGLNGQWTVGRQFITLDLDADDNRFVRNDNLNNVSSTDAFKWNWILGSKLTGQIGTDFARSLGGFYNTFVYTRDIVDQTEYFGSARYAVGPHIALFGGVLYTDTTLSEAALKVNDNQRKAVDFGLEYATAAASSLDFDYRYTDARYSHSSFLNGVAFDPDYRDETGRVTFKDMLSEKTQIEALVGYLKRTYPSAAIGAFAGNIWRLTFDWHPTGKTELLIGASRDLQAYLGAQTDYFVSKAVSIAPTWIPSEKISVAVVLSRDDQDFIGTNEFVLNLANRRDIVNAGQVNVVYSPLVFTPARGLTFNFTLRREHRASNQAALSYDDTIGKAGFIFKF
jgi:glycosyltransferase involved in cell wall biosynthesis